MSEPAQLRVDVLGSLRVTVNAVPIEIRGPKRRAIFVLLALAEGRSVTVDQLLAALWPAAGPESERQALQSHVSRIRSDLGPAAGRLRTGQDGYRLDLVEPSEARPPSGTYGVSGDGVAGHASSTGGTTSLDVARCRALLTSARAQRAAPAEALALLTEAHGLWRGPILADLTDVPAIAAAVHGFEGLRQQVIDELVAAHVDAGRAEPALGLAETAVAADPLREPAVLGLMRALAATGQAARALDVAREYRQRLADETGLDPSAALGELERGIAGGAAAPPTTRVAVPARPTTRLVGRQTEVGALHGVLATGRLVTVVGPGGVGKTRLAVEVAHQTTTVATLLLAPVTDPGALGHALAAALGVTVAQGDVLTACAAILGDRPGLLLIDNCEHLLDAVRDAVAVLLAACPRLTVLATSREPLGLPEEHVSRLAPLPVPGRDGQVATVPSVAVFLDRAARVRPTPPTSPEELRTVADIVRRLDGMPLAIELAAGRLSSFSLGDLRDRLDRSLDLLAGGRVTGDARHRTLRATVEWSYQLLTDDERTLFRHLSVFAGGVDLDTAESVAADLQLVTDPGSALARLVDASMIDASFDGGPRYRMLETLRTFGIDRLVGAGEADAAHARLVRWAVEFLTRIDAVVATADEPAADAALRREPANLRTAWRLTRDEADLDNAAAMVIALHEVATWRDLTEIWDWPLELAADPALAGHPREADVLGVASEFAYLRGRYLEAERLAAAALARATDPTATWRGHSQLAVALLGRGDYAAVLDHAQAAAALTVRPTYDLADAALGATFLGDPERARGLAERALEAAVSPTERGFATYSLAEIDNAAAHPLRGEESYRTAIDLGQRAGSTFLIGIASAGLVTALASQGRADDALRGYRDVIDYFARNSNWTHLWATLRNLATLLRRLGDDGPAAVLETAADRAPDAPPGPAPSGPVPSDPMPDPDASGPAGPGRVEVLDIARRAIDRHLRG